MEVVEVEVKVKLRREWGRKAVTQHAVGRRPCSVLVVVGDGLVPFGVVPSPLRPLTR